jgi:non-specific serine/threonine protein kinase
VVQLLAGLVEKSLIMVETYEHQRRYRLLEMVRQAAAEPVQASEEYPVLCRRHCAWFGHFAQHAAAELSGPHQTVWLQRLAVDHDNFRAALQWAVGHDPQAGIQLALSLSRFWLVRGYLTEGRHWFERLIACTPAVPSLLRVQLLRLAGEFAARQADLVRAKLLLDQAYTLVKETNSYTEELEIVILLGGIALHQSNLAAARASYQKALELAQAQHDLPRQAEVLARLTQLELRHGHYRCPRR